MIDKLSEYKEYLVIGGLAVGALYILGILPTEVDFFDLKENVRYVYVGLIALGAYAFYNFYWGHYTGHKSFQRTVASRNLSNPTYRQNVAQQRATGAPGIRQSPAPRVPTPPPEAIARNPNSKIWDTFNRE